MVNEKGMAPIIAEAQTLLLTVARIEAMLAKQQIIKALELTKQLYRKIFEIGGLNISWDLYRAAN